MKVANTYAQLSKAERLKVGALLVSPDFTRPLIAGYNGTPSGYSNICEKDNKTLPEVIHAEANVIAAAAKNGISTNYCVLYCTHAPCIECAKLIIQSGIKTVIYETEYRSTLGLELLNSMKVKVLSLSDVNK